MTKSPFGKAVFLLRLLCICSVACHASCQAKPGVPGERTESPPPEEGITADSTSSVPQRLSLQVYYFHTTYRCRTCNKIEALTKEAVEENFAEELDSGTIAFSAVDIESPGNEHFVQDYKLVTKSVIISEVEDGRQTRWKNLDKVWGLVRNPEEFRKYVVAEIEVFRDK